HQWHDQPVIAGSDLPIRTLISPKRLLFPSRNVWWSPPISSRLFVKRCGLMPDIGDSQFFAGPDGSDCLTNQNSIHDDVITDLEVAACELVFGRNVPAEGVRMPVKLNSISGREMIERNKHIVAGIELEHLERRQSRFSLFSKRKLRPVIVKHFAALSAA